MVFTEFDWVFLYLKRNRPSFAGSYLVLPSFMGHEWVSRGFPGL